MKAIIIVDCQNDFSELGTLPVSGAVNLASKISDFLATLDRQQYKIIASRDWHPQGHVSFARWPVHCVANTFGAEYIKPLDAFKFDLEILKGTDVAIDSYSAFYENSNLSSLKQYLTNNKIKQVYVCGLVMDICVLQTANDSMKFKFDTTVLTDLTIPLNFDHYTEKIDPCVKNIKSEALNK